MQLNPNDTPPEWETKWAENEWEPESLNFTEDEQKFLDELTSEVLPRHMPFLRHFNLFPFLIIFNEHINEKAKKSNDKGNSAEWR